MLSAKTFRASGNTPGGSQRRRCILPFPSYFNNWDGRGNSTSKHNADERERERESEKVRERG